MKKLSNYSCEKKTGDKSRCLKDTDQASYQLIPQIQEIRLYIEKYYKIASSIGPIPFLKYNYLS